MGDGTTRLSYITVVVIRVSGSVNRKMMYIVRNLLLVYAIAFFIYSKAMRPKFSPPSELPTYHG